MAVTYDYYRIFYYVAKYRSFTRAAKVLMNSQPNITRSMNNLEQELGCRLFLRSHRGVTLTPEGEKLFAHVQIAQEQLLAGEAELVSGRTLQTGSVSIGASETALHGMLLPVLRRFHLQYPGVHIRINNHSTTEAVSALKKGSVDFAVVATPTGVSRSLQEIPLKQFQDILIGGPSFSHLAGQTLPLSRINEYPLICLSRDTKTYEFFDRFFAEHGELLHPDIEAATADQVLPMVTYDLGLGLLPESFARDAIKKGEVFQIRLAETIPPRHICLVLDKSRPLGAAALELKRMLLGG